MANEKTPEQVIKDLAKSSGALITGIASVDEINRYAPKGYQPSDLLLGARSVIVFAGPMALAGAYRSPSSRVRGVNRSFPVIRSRIAFNIAQFIEKEYGHYCIYEPVGTSHGLIPFFSVKLCAELAGLGTRSMAAGIIMHPEYGMLSFSFVITTMELKADGAMSIPACPHPSCVTMWEKQQTTPCLDACPDCLSGEMENGRIKWMKYYRHLCMTRAQSMGIYAFQKAFSSIIEEPDPEKRKMMALSSSFNRMISSIANSTELVGQCSVCVVRCPLVAKQYTLKPKTGGK